MARTKKEYSAPKVMKLAGDGLEDVIVTRRAKTEEKDGKTVEIAPADSFNVRVPKDGAGIIAYQKACNEAGLDGNDILLTALRNAIIKQATGAREEAFKNEKPLPDVLSLVPDFSSVRVTDPNEAASNQFLAALKSGAIKMDDPAVKALFGKLAK